MQRKKNNLIPNIRLLFYLTWCFSQLELCFTCVFLTQEFDRQASATVQRMFDEISQMLFEGKGFDGKIFNMVQDDWVSSGLLFYINTMFNLS